MVVAGDDVGHRSPLHTLLPFGVQEDLAPGRLFYKCECMQNWRKVEMVDFITTSLIAISRREVNLKA